MDSITKEEFYKSFNLLINDFKVHSNYILDMNNGTHGYMNLDLFKRESKAIIADCNDMNRLINRLLFAKKGEKNTF